MLAFFVAIGVASWFYAYANFNEVHSKNMVWMVTVALMYAAVEYSIKIPTYHLYRKQFTPAQLQMFWLGATTMSVLIYQYLYTTKTMKAHTMVTVVGIVSLLAVETWLDQL
jgi:uncharacterized protein (DUF486 family)